MADTVLTNILPTVPNVPNFGKSADPAVSDPWIFRKGNKTISGRNVIVGISHDLDQGREGWINGLIRAGELEAALSDAGDRHSSIAAQITDLLAEAVVTGEKLSADAAALLLARVIVPETITISPPEGFTYYALHPLDFSRAGAHLNLQERDCAIIGIRSIGTTLSAMVAAGLKSAGVKCSRITVRPSGHPYSRETTFTPEHIEWLRERQSAEAHFLIVDEGPGRSGSTFLSVAEALLGQTLARKQITMIGSRQPDPESLCARDAGERWQRFRYIATKPSVNSRFADCLYAGGGSWREVLLSDRAQWPESWIQMERLKFISPDRKTLFKFEGMGRIGSDIRARATALSEAKFIPRFEWSNDGFAAHELVSGRRLEPADAECELLSHMARYCAFRYKSFRVGESAGSELGHMVEFNAKQEFGIELRLPETTFQRVDAVVVDGRMQPWEWISPKPGNFLKTDASDHGDNHFFPGPCDVAWDIAGIAIEWELGSSAQEFLVREFRRLSGVDVSLRMKDYLLAYSILNASYCRMAGCALQGTEEEARLQHAYARYRDRAWNLLHGRDSGANFSKREAA